MNRAKIMGRKVDLHDVESAAEYVRHQCLFGSGFEVVHTINVDHYAIGRRNSAFSSFMDAAHLTVADGAPVVLAGRIAGHGRMRRVTGQDLFNSLAMHPAPSIDVFLLGSSEEVNRRAFQKLNESAYPGFRPVGRLSPTPDQISIDERSQEIVRMINDSGAHLLVVTLGAPRQELWMARWADELRCNVGIGLGSTLDVFSGQIRRAPVVIQRLGLEWAHRMFSEPRRLARRYLLDDVPVAARLLAWAIRQRLKLVCSSN